MEADLESYLEEGVERLQDRAGQCPCLETMRKRLCVCAKESEALLSDLMVDQPLLWLSIAFSVGLLFGKTVFSRK